MGINEVMVGILNCLKEDKPVYAGRVFVNKFDGNGVLLGGKIDVIGVSSLTLNDGVWHKNYFYRNNSECKIARGRNILVCGEGFIYADLGNCCCFWYNGMMSIYNGDDKVLVGVCNDKPVIAIEHKGHNVFVGKLYGCPRLLPDYIEPEPEKYYVLPVYVNRHSFSFIDEVPVYNEIVLFGKEETLRMSYNDFQWCMKVGLIALDNLILVRNSAEKLVLYGLDNSEIFIGKDIVIYEGTIWYDGVAYTTKSKDLLYPTVHYKGGLMVTSIEKVIKYRANRSDFLRALV